MHCVQDFRHNPVCNKIKILKRFRSCLLRIGIFDDSFVLANNFSCIFFSRFFSSSSLCERHRNIRTTTSPLPTLVLLYYVRFSFGLEFFILFIIHIKEMEIKGWWCIVFGICVFHVRHNISSLLFNTQDCVCVKVSECVCPCVCVSVQLILFHRNICAFAFAQDQMICLATVF